LGGKVGIWKQAQKLVIMSEPKSTAPQGDIPLELIQTPLRFRLSRMPHGRHIKEERKK
jgi:hypothetical protein